MEKDENFFDFVKAEPSIRDQFIKMGLAAVAGFVVESLVKAGYDRYVGHRHKGKA